MKDAIKKARERLEEVIKKGESVLGTKQSGSMGHSFLVDEDGYVQWRLSAQTILQTLNSNGQFEGEFQKIDTNPSSWLDKPDRLADQLGVMRALRENFDGGYLPRNEESTEIEASPKTDDDERPLVFISCGQFTTAEIYLGKAIAKLVEEQTGAVGYFAQNQTSLDSLTEHIFRALDRASGFIAVMHKRGQVMNQNGEVDRTRASVWVEQETAIASFVQKTKNANLRVQAYVEKGITLEGAREKLMLNPKPFTTNGQVTKHLKKELQMWKLS